MRINTSISADESYLIGFFIQNQTTPLGGRFSRANIMVVVANTSGFINCMMIV